MAAHLERMPSQVHCRHGGDDDGGGDDGGDDDEDDGGDDGGDDNVDADCGYNGGGDDDHDHDQSCVGGLRGVRVAKGGRRGVGGWVGKRGGGLGGA